MDTDSILTFQAPGRETMRVTCTASPVMELVYAFYYIQLRVGDDATREHEVTWVAPLLESHDALVQSVRSFCPRHEVEGLGPALLVLAARYGYDRDDGPDRFVRDLPTLPGRYVEDGWEARDAAADDAPGPGPSLGATVVRMSDGGMAADLCDLLTRLWAALGPSWTRDGRAAVSLAVAEFQAAFERTGSVLDSLPPHHFTRFEHLAHGIRDAEARGRVVVVPLYLASTGGFNFLIDDGHYVGFGLQSETVFERTAQQAALLAHRAKALGEPTRLMALALVGRFSTMRLTVGDLADQIGVSQPTLSGHLKLLREAGLVSVERSGNKSYYSIDREGVRDLLQQLDRVLLD